MKHYTSIEQSKKLLELGLDPRTADMFYLEDWIKQGVPIYHEFPEARKSNYPDDDLPCWSVGALLELLPYKIYGPAPKDHSTDLLIGRTIPTQASVSYFDWTGMQHGPNFIADTYLEAVYNAVVWLLENGHIDKVESKE